nr:conidiation-specific protein 10 [Quercus suber]
MHPTLPAHHRQLELGGTIRPRVERWLPALACFGSVVMAAATEMRYELWTFAHRRRIEGEKVAVGGVGGIEDEEILVELRRCLDWTHGQTKGHASLYESGRRVVGRREVKQLGKGSSGIDRRCGSRQRQTARWLRGEGQVPDGKVEVESELKQMENVKNRNGTGAGFPCHAAARRCCRACSIVSSYSNLLAADGHFQTSTPYRPVMQYAIDTGSWVLNQLPILVLVDLEQYKNVGSRRPMLQRPYPDQLLDLRSTERAELGLSGKVNTEKVRRQQSSRDWPCRFISSNQDPTLSARWGRGSDQRSLALSIQSLAPFTGVEESRAPKHVQKTRTMSSTNTKTNNNPGNFANRPTDEVKTIASMGGKASHGGGAEKHDTPAPEGRNPDGTFTKGSEAAKQAGHVGGMHSHDHDEGSMTGQENEAAGRRADGTFLPGSEAAKDAGHKGGVAAAEN